MSRADLVAQSALDLFARQGFPATGIRQIARAAGITSAGLYNYVGNKEELLARLALEANSRLLTIVRSLLVPEDPPESRLVTLVRTHVMGHVLHQQEALVVDTELRHLSEEHRAPVIEVRDRYEDLWREVLRDGAAAGTFSFVDARTTRLALLEMCTGVAHWYDPAGGLTPPGLAGQFADLALALVRAQRDGRPLTLLAVRSPSDEAILAAIEAT